MYCFVGRPEVPLCDYALPGTTGNFNQVTQVLSKKLPAEDGKVSYAYDAYTFHCLTSYRLHFVCLSSHSFSRSCVRSSLHHSVTICRAMHSSASSCSSLCCTFGSALHPLQRRSACFVQGAPQGFNSWLTSGHVCTIPPLSFGKPARDTLDDIDEVVDRRGGRRQAAACDVCDQVAVMQAGPLCNALMHHLQIQELSVNARVIARRL